MAMSVQDFINQWSQGGKVAGGADYAYQMSKATGAGRAPMDPSMATSSQDLRHAFADQNRDGMGIEQASQTFLTPEQRAQMAMLRQGGMGLPGQPGNMGDFVPPLHGGGLFPNTQAANTGQPYTPPVGGPAGNVPVGAAAVGNGGLPAPGPSPVDGRYLGPPTQAPGMTLAQLSGRMRNPFGNTRGAM